MLYPAVRPVFLGHFAQDDVDRRLRAAQRLAYGIREPGDQDLFLFFIYTLPNINFDKWHDLPPIPHISPF